MTVIAFEGARIQRSWEIGDHPLGFHAEKLEDEAHGFSYEIQLHDNPASIHTGWRRNAIGQVDFAPADYDADELVVTSFGRPADWQYDHYPHDIRRQHFVGTFMKTFDEIDLEYENLNRLKLRLPSDEDMALAITDAGKPNGWRRYFIVEPVNNSYGSRVSPRVASRLATKGIEVLALYERTGTLTQAIDLGSLAVAA